MASIILLGVYIVLTFYLDPWLSGRGLRSPSFLRYAMDYDEACEAIVTRREVFWELEDHGASFLEFAAEYGDKEEYVGKDVLDFLGY